MADLIPSADKAKFESVFDDIHDTFARDITIYKTTKKTFIATNNTYNALYSRIKDEKGLNKEVTGTVVKARISYFNPQDNEDAMSYQLGVRAPSGTVRIKVDPTGFNLIMQAKDLEIDGDLFDVMSDPSRVGLFSVKYYEVSLKRKD